MKSLLTILLCAVLASAGFITAVQLGLPGFADERKGWIGIPSSLGYAVGSRSGVQALGAILYFGYGTVIGIFAALVQRALDGPPEDREER